MNLEMFLLMLLVVSVLTGLFTEAIKDWLKERNKTYYPNALAGWVSVILSVLVGAGYIIMTETTINAQMAV
ncbi:MAG: aminopeptidase, partial [Eubacteriales bacterium]|nr:aminopeptidase [Eubacteriales bacterium]